MSINEARKIIALHLEERSAINVRHLETLLGLGPKIIRNFRNL